jgi:hypothetical protein
MFSKSPLHIKDLTQHRRVSHTKANIAASQTLTTLVAAPPVVGERIAVFGFFAVTGATATEMTLYSGSTAISPLLANAANSGVILQPGSMPWFVCAPGEALKITTGAGSATGLMLITANISG